MAYGMDPGALDRYITGNYGEDQFKLLEAELEDDTEEVEDADSEYMDHEEHAYWDRHQAEERQAAYDEQWGDPLHLPSYGD